MSITLKSTSNFGRAAAASSKAVAFTSNNTAGNLLVVLCGYYNGGVKNTITVSDSAGNDYSGSALALDFDDTGGGSKSEFKIFFIPSCIDGANTVTVSVNLAVVDLFLHISEWSYANTIALDKTASGSNASSSNPTSSSVTTTADGELVIGLVDFSSSVTTGSGFTALTGDNGGASVASKTEYQIQSSAGSIAANWTSGSQLWGVAMATFKEVSSGVVDDMSWKKDSLVSDLVSLSA